MDFLKLQRELSGRLVYRFDLRDESFTFKCPSSGIELVLAKELISGFEVKVTKEDYLIWLRLVGGKVVMLGTNQIYFPFDASRVSLKEVDFNYWSTHLLREDVLEFVANREGMDSADVLGRLDYHSAMIDSAMELGFKVSHFKWVMEMIKEACFYEGLRVVLR